MKRFLLLFLISGVLCLEATAQQNNYTTHTIVKGETLSALAKKYHTSVGDIMRLNGMHADSKLAIGQKIKIPAAGTTVAAAEQTTVQQKKVETIAQPAGNGTTAGSVHIVKKGETLYSISKKYGVSIDQIKEWNNITGSSIAVGEELSIGGAKSGSAAVQVNKQLTEVPPPAKDNQVAQDTKANTAAETNAAVAKTATVGKQETATNVDPVVNAAANPPAESPKMNAAVDGSDNFFAKEYLQAKNSKVEKSVAGTSGIFKSASGWDDKKFYILMNEAATGSIVKIKASNGNIVYAKVLWPIDDIKSNEGLKFRISDATAAALGITDQKFGLNVQYH